MIEFIQTGESLAGTPLLFLHGLGGDATNWLPQLDGLGRHRRCIAWTMPGYGTSPADGLESFESLTAEAVGLLDQLNCEQVSVVGLSMGGYVAQQMALDFPDRVDRLVLAATTAAFGKPGSTFNEEFLGSRLAALDAGATPASIAEGLVDGLLGSNPDPAARANAVASMRRIQPDAYRQALQTLVTWNISDRLAEITQPVLALAGAEDGTAPERAMSRMVDGLGNATLQVIQDSGHLINLEKPDEFNLAVQTFLEIDS